MAVTTFQEKLASAGARLGKLSRRRHARLVRRYGRRVSGAAGRLRPVRHELAGQAGADRRRPRPLAERHGHQQCPRPCGGTRRVQLRADGAGTHRGRPGRLQPRRLRAGHHAIARRRRRSRRSSTATSSWTTSRLPTSATSCRRSESLARKRAQILHSQPGSMSAQLEPGTSRSIWCGATSASPSRAARIQTWTRTKSGSPPSRPTPCGTRSSRPVRRRSAARRWSCIASRAAFLATDVDLSQRDLPQETEQKHALNFTKGCYIGQEIVERIRARAILHRTFTGFLVEGEPPQPGTKVQVDGKNIGEITSAATRAVPQWRAHGGAWLSAPRV